MTKRRKSTRNASARLRTTRRAKKTHSGRGRIVRAYRLTNGVPDGLRENSAGRSILEAIKKLTDGDKSATKVAIRARLGDKMPDPTLRFFLGKFQREKVLTVAT